MQTVKPGTWLHDLIEVYNDLGGQAAYGDVYPLAKLRREGRGASWTKEAKASIRRTVEDHAESSANFRGKPVFYSVNGHGRGVWGLLPDHLQPVQNDSPRQEQAYLEGLEGIVQEKFYLRRSRDPRLVENRKERDNYTCQVCGFRQEVGDGKFVIDVHHLLPLGGLMNVVITSIDDLVCLCPNCHRIAHSKRGTPLTLVEISAIRRRH
jgi:hypothetical protein